MRGKRVKAIGLLVVGIIILGHGGIFSQEHRDARNTITPFLLHSDIVVDLNRQYALIIGINEYSRLPYLNNAVYDAWSLKELLVDNYGYRKENIKELYDDDATYQQIESQLRGLLTRLEPDDFLLIYFSGHGHRDGNVSRGYWLPWDACQDVKSDRIPVTDKNLIDRTSFKIPSSDIQVLATGCRARHIFIVSDSCYAAELIATRQGIQYNLPESFNFKSRQVLASGRERVSDGSPGEHSPFARHLLGYLRKNRARYVLGSKIIYHTRRVVVINRDKGVHQEPFGGPLISAGHEGGEFYFFLRQIYAPEKSVSNCIAKGDSALRQKSYNQARKHYQRILDKFPDDKYAKKRFKEIPISTIPPEIASIPPKKEKTIAGHLMVYIPELNIYVDKYEVSYSQFEMVFKGKRKKSGIPLIRGLTPGHPAIVTYEEAREYCRKKGLRLLTDDEWEFAAGKQQGYRCSWGNTEVDAAGVYRANYRSLEDGYDLIAPVRSFEKFSSPYGIVNLSGNAWEWVQGKKCKGGGFLSDKKDLNIFNTAKKDAVRFIGFRCARKAGEVEK